MSSLLNVVLVAFLGAAVGSFLATIVLRHRQRTSIALGRSRCDSCDRVLTPLELIPFVSYVLQAGRCTNCRAPIPILHPSGELVACTVAVTSYLVLPPAEFGPALWFGWLLCLLGLFDYRYGILPIALTAVLLSSGLIYATAKSSASLENAAIGATVGFVCLALLAFAYRRIRGRDGLGGGDIVLVAGLGAWVGPTNLPIVLFGAALFAIVGVTIRAVMDGSLLRADSSIAFGPYLAFSGWATFIGAQSY